MSARLRSSGDAVPDEGVGEVEPGLANGEPVGAPRSWWGDGVRGGGTPPDVDGNAVVGTGWSVAVEESVEAFGDMGSAVVAGAVPVAGRAGGRRPAAAPTASCRSCQRSWLRRPRPEGNACEHLMQR